MNETTFDARGRGALIVLVGPDGVGKTTVARAILAQRPGRAAYFHFVPPVFGRLASDADQGAPLPVAKHAGPGSRVLGGLRLVRNAARCWAGYLITIRPALKRNCVVVGDRWLYGYVAQPQALKFHGPDRMARLVLRLLPRPDLVVNLAAPPDVIRRRKQELTLREIEAELCAWSSLPVHGVQTLDATGPPAALGAAILAALPSRARDGRHAHV